MAWQKHIAAGVAALVAWIAALPDAVWLLVILQVADIGTGVLRACRDGQLCSQIGMHGMIRKTAMWVLVGACYAIRHRAHLDVPIGDMAALYFVAIEGISLAENAALLGVPTPPALRRWLQAVRKAGDDQEEQSSGA